MEKQHGFYGIADTVAHKRGIDAFFQKSLQEIDFFDQVIIVRQYEFEKIIIAGEEKKKALLSLPISLELGALKKRHQESAVGDEEYMRKQRKFVNEYARTRVIFDTVPVVSDLTRLHYVQEHYGDHLLVGVVVKRHYASSRYEVDLKILDPATGDTVLHAHNEKYVWNHVDEPLFYPLFNALIDWIEKNLGGSN
ncbi:MAG: hypothetical protein GWP69_03075 [Gammaproteobacteria bacterium]|nr:hypothetical protein [Gammaproteobacteria bacterium]